MTLENVENNSGRYGLAELMKAEGYTRLDELMADCLADSINPAICRDCGYTTGMEPDQHAGYCEDCQSNTVVSALVLAGMI